MARSSVSSVFANPFFTWQSFLLFVIWHNRCNSGITHYFWSICRLPFPVNFSDYPIRIPETTSNLIGVQERVQKRKRKKKGTSNGFLCGTRRRQRVLSSFLFRVFALRKRTPLRHARAKQRKSGDGDSLKLKFSL